MRLPKFVQMAEAANKKQDRSRRVLSPGLSSTAGISKTPAKKKRADKLRALAGAFSTEAGQADKGRNPSGSVDPFVLRYDALERIGTGKEGVSVSRCIQRSTGLSFAVKRVPKAPIGTVVGDERPAIATLSGSSQLIATHEVLESIDALYYIMDLAPGGDLFEFISTRGPCDEQRARALFAGLLAAIQQVHRTGYIHRDIKLENILLMHADPTLPEQVRLADFEFCTSVPAVGPVGSMAYAAPEVLDGNHPYSGAVDLWAAGCVLYSMLSAAAPFESSLGGAAETAARIRNAQPNMPFSEPCWAMISPAAKDLVNGLLHPDPLCRLTVEAAILHPWLSGSTQLQAATPTARPKFSMRCTWHTEAKRWSNQSTGGAGGELRMLVDDDEQSPLVACPLEWGPTGKTRCRANSM